MIKRNSQILFFVGMFCASPLYATNYQEQDKSTNNAQKTTVNPKLSVTYYDYTLQYSKKKIDNTVDPEELEEEQQDLKEGNRIMEKLTRKQGAVFFMVIVSDKKTKQLSKFFFINRKPNREKSAIRNVERASGCHVISRNLGLSPHLIFQLLGWLAQEESRYIPVFIHTNSPLCVTCHAIVLNFFKLDMPKHTKGCNGTKAVDLEKVCPLAQKYINSCLTLSLAKKILFPSQPVVPKSKLDILKSSKDHQESNNLNNTFNSLEEENASLKSEKLLLQGRLKNRDIYVKLVEKSKGDLQHKYDKIEVARDTLDKELLAKIDSLHIERDALSKKLDQIDDLIKKASAKPYLYPHSLCISYIDLKKIIDSKK